MFHLLDLRAISCTAVPKIRAPLVYFLCLQLLIGLKFLVCGTFIIYIIVMQLVFIFLAFLKCPAHFTGAHVSRPWNWTLTFG